MKQQLTLAQIHQGIEKLKRRIADVRKLGSEQLAFDDAAVRLVENNIRETVRELFGEESPEYHKVRSFDIAAFLLAIGVCMQAFQRR